MSRKSTITTRNFCKLFNIDGWQVLFHVEPNGKEYLVHQIVYVEELGTVDVTLGYNEENAWIFFDAVDEAHAKTVLVKAQHMVAAVTD